MTPALESTEAVDALDDNAFLKYVAQLSVSELSLSGYLRFIRLTHPKSGNYTEDRHQWLDGITVEEFLADVKTQETAH